MRSVFRQNLHTRKMSFLSTFCILSLAYSLPYFLSISLWLPQAISTVPNPDSVLFFPLQCTQFDIGDYQKLYILTSAFSSGTAAGRWRKLYIILHMGNYVKRSEELYCQENVCSRSFSRMSQSKLFLWQRCIGSVFWYRYRNIKPEGSI